MSSQHNNMRPILNLGTPIISLD